MKTIILLCAVIGVGSVISSNQNLSTLAAANEFTYSESAPSLWLAQKSPIYVRTENYPRPPYSGATYYIYEKDDEVICTKLEVCNKFDDCSVKYRKGSFKEEEDIETGDPYGSTEPVIIPNAKLQKHVCLTKFKLVR